MTALGHPVDVADPGPAQPGQPGSAPRIWLRRLVRPRPARRAQLISQLFAIIDEGSDWARLSEVFRPSVVYHRPGYPAIHGIEELQTFYAHTRQVATGQHHLYQVVSEGPVSCCCGTFSCTTKAGERIVVDFTDWYRFAKGKISTRRTFFYQPVI
jgi:uncharacterized protein